MADENRPTWNAAQPYYAYLIGLLRDRSTACLLHDSVTWHRCLSQIFNTAGPFINEKEYEQLKKRLEEIAQKLNQHPNFSKSAQNVIRQELDRELMTLDGDILKSAKHLWLPLITTEKNWDENQLFQESNIITK